MGQNKIIVLIIIVLSLGIGPSSAHAKTATKVPVKTPSYWRIFYYQSTKEARASLVAHAKDIDVIAPQAYKLDNNGLLSGGVDADVLATARKYKIKVMPLVTNSSFDAASAEELLDNSVGQDRAIRMMIDEAIKNKWWGWQIDFEQMNIYYRDKFSAFVERCHAAFKENNLILSVAVVAQISDNPKDYITDKHNDLWQRLIGVYDYAALGASADFVSLMSYDDPGSKNAPARAGWVKLAVNYALKFIPPQKLSLGIPLYYWQWNGTTGKHVGTGGYKGIKNVLNKYRTTRGYDAAVGAAYIKYTVKKIHYTIWYVNAKSVKQDVALIKKYGLQGFSAWALGQESPDIFTAIRK